MLNKAIVATFIATSARALELRLPGGPTSMGSPEGQASPVEDPLQLKSALAGADTNGTRRRETLARSTRPTGITPPETVRYR